MKLLVVLGTSEVVSQLLCPDPLDRPTSGFKVRLTLILGR
jgi:hypothetical protein